MKNKNRQKGISLLGIIVLGFVLILVLGYFNVSVEEVVESPQAQENLDYVKGETRTLWERYLSGPVTYLWQDVWVDIFWEGFLNNMERIRDGLPTDFDKAAGNLEVKQ
jgi:hypothetical protein